MGAGGQLYLILVIASFAVFGGMLAYFSESQSKHLSGSPKAGEAAKAPPTS
jgi:hypothetical protein